MSARSRWLMLMHQLPPQPDYFRVKVWRRLKAIGAIPIKNSVYVLPNTAEAREDFEWLLREIVAGGGDATLCETSFLAGITNEEVEMMIAEALRRDGSSQADRKKSRGIPGIGRRPAGATWVTRHGIHVDRIASAWLIRRFIDARARFKFVKPVGYNRADKELRFDMYDAEFTHVGALCTLEVLVRAFKLDRDKALKAVAEIVHDIDCKDEAFKRPETTETAQALEKLYARHASDEARLEHGAVLFESLYAMFGGKLTPRNSPRQS
jgi:hypothetical protein